MQRTVAVLALAAAMGAAAWAQDTRSTIRALAGKCLDARRAVAHNCSKCEGSGKEHRPVTDARGYRSIEVTCPTCSGAGLIFVQTKADEVKACFWKGSRYPGALWGRGSSGRGAKREKRPPAAARVIGLAEDAGWLTDTTSVDKVGEVRTTNGVQWTEVKLQIGDSTPGSFTYVKFPEGWRIVAPDEIDAAVVAAGGRPGADANAPGGQGGPPREGGAAAGERNGGAGVGERPAAAREVGTARRTGAGRRCRARNRNGEWREEGGALVGTDTSGQSRIVLAEDLADYDVSFQFRLEARPGAQPREGFKFRTLMHYASDAAKVWINFDNDATPRMIAREFVPGRNLGRRIEERALELGRPYEFRAVVRGRKIDTYLDGAKLHSFTTEVRARGDLGFDVCNARVTIKDLLVVDPQGNVLFGGAPELN